MWKWATTENRVAKAQKGVRQEPNQNLISSLEVPLESEEEPDRGVDRDEELRTNEERVLALKTQLKKIYERGKKYNMEGSKYRKGLTAIGEILDKMGSAEKQWITDSVYGPALEKFGEIQNDISEQHAHFHQEAHEKFLAEIVQFVTQDISYEIKIVKGKYDKARSAYTAAGSKVMTLRSKTKLDVMKLLIAEKELVKAKRRYEEALDEALSKLEDIEIKKNCMLLEWMIECFAKRQKETYQHSYEALVEIERYLGELEAWCTEARTAYDGEVRVRHAKQAQREKEDTNLYEPLIKAIKDSKAIQDVMRAVAEEEHTRIALSGVDQNITALHEFLRVNYHQISQRLLDRGKKNDLVELTSALGYLEKEKL